MCTFALLMLSFAWAINVRLVNFGFNVFYWFMKWVWTLRKFLHTCVFFLELEIWNGMEYGCNLLALHPNRAHIMSLLWSEIFLTSIPHPASEEKPLHCVPILSNSTHTLFIVYPSQSLFFQHSINHSIQKWLTDTAEKHFLGNPVFKAAVYGKM